MQAGGSGGSVVQVPYIMSSRASLGYVIPYLKQTNRMCKESGRASPMPTGIFRMLTVGISCREKYQTRQSSRAILQVVFNPAATRTQRQQAHISASHRLDESKIVDRSVGGPLHRTGRAISCQVGCGSCVLPGSLCARLLGASLVSAF